MAPTSRSMQMLIALILFKGSAAVIEASGVGDALGISATTNTAPGQFQQANETAASTDPSSGFDLFGVFITYGQDFESIFSILFQAELMLISAGVPAWLIGPVLAPIYLIIFRDVYYFISGR